MTIPMAHLAAEEAFHKAMEAAYEMERAAAGSEEHRLAKKAYDIFLADYRELAMGERKCSCGVPCCWPGNRIYDV